MTTRSYSIPVCYHFQDKVMSICLQASWKRAKKQWQYCICLVPSEFGVYLSFSTYEEKKTSVNVVKCCTKLPTKPISFNLHLHYYCINGSPLNEASTLCHF